MPTKLNVGANQKIVDDNHGSHGASVSLEIDLDANLATDSAELQERLRELFGLIHQSLTEELHRRRNGQAPPRPTPADQSAPSSPPPNGRKPINGRQRGAARLATPAQIRALFGIARRQQLSLHEIIRSRCGVESPDDLSLQQASELIDALTSESDSNA